MPSPRSYICTCTNSCALLVQYLVLTQLQNHVILIKSFVYIIRHCSGCHFQTAGRPNQILNWFRKSFIAIIQQYSILRIYNYIKDACFGAQVCACPKERRTPTTALNKPFSIHNKLVDSLKYFLVAFNIKVCISI